MCLKGGRQGFAKLLPQSGSALASSRIREWCSGKLPGYSVPTRFVFHDSLPRTPGGKIDRLKLGRISIGDGGLENQTRKRKPSFIRSKSSKPLPFSIPAVFRVPRRVTNVASRLERTSFALPQN